MYQENRTSLAFNNWEEKVQSLQSLPIARPLFHDSQEDKLDLNQSLTDFLYGITYGLTTKTSLAQHCYSVYKNCPMKKKLCIYMLKVLRLWLKRRSILHHRPSTDVNHSLPFNTIHLLINILISGQNKKTRIPTGFNNNESSCGLCEPLWLCTNAMNSLSLSRFCLIRLQS